MRGSYESTDKSAVSCSHAIHFFTPIRRTIDRRFAVVVQVLAHAFLGSRFRRAGQQRDSRGHRQRDFQRHQRKAAHSAVHAGAGEGGIILIGQNHY